MKNINCSVSKFKGSGFKHQAGFTLVELLVVIAMVAIFTPVLYFTFGRLMRSYTTENVKADVQQTARYGIEYMVRDIRMAGFDPLDKADTGIEYVLSSKIRLTADLNLDGNIDDTDYERITYEYDAANEKLDQVIYEGTGSENTQALVENVTGLTFRYFDDSNPENEITPDPTNPTDPNIIEDIKTVEIDMTVREPAGAEGFVDRRYTTRVRIRNLDVI